MEEIVFKNLGIKIVNNPGYWTIVNLENKKESKTWAVYDKTTWLDKLRLWDKTLFLTYETFIEEIKK